MPAIHVRDLDGAVVDALKARAARNRRSLQGEIRTILEQAAEASSASPGKSKRRLRLRTVRVGAPVRYSRDVVYEDENR